MYKVESRVIKFLGKDNKTVISSYRIFQRSDGKKLVFYPVPKNANSSFKKLFVELLSIEKDYLFLDDEIPMYKKDKYKLDSNKNYLRTCLKQSLINNLQYNERRQHDSIKLFEISNIYSSDINKNKRVLAIIASGRVDKNYKDFSKKIDKNYISSIFDNVIDSENLNLTFISRDNLKSKLTTPIIYSEININSLKDIDLSHFEKKSKKIKKLQYIQISDFPSSVRDLSFSVKEPKKSEELVSSILGFNHELLKEKFIFDYYYNEKILEVKIGFRFIFQSSESTITDNQVNDVIEKIIKITRKIDSVSIPGIN